MKDKYRHVATEAVFGRLTLFFLVFIGFLLRTYHLTSQSLWLDEALCVKIAAIQDLGKMLVTIINEVHPPLFYLLLRLWMFLFGNTDLSVRLFSVFWGCVGLFGIYFLCRYGLDWSRKNSNLATLIAAIIPMHVFYSQDVRPYSMMFALSCFMLGFLFRAHRSMKIKLYILFGLFQAILLYVHHSTLIFCFVINVLYLLILLYYRQSNPIRIRGIIIAGLISFILYLPWLPFLLKQLKNPILFSGFWFWVDQPRFFDFFYGLAGIIGVWKLNLPVEIPIYFYILLIFPMAALLLLGSLSVLKRKNQAELLLALTIVVYPLFIFFLSHVILPVWLFRLFIPAAIGVPIIAVLGFEKSLFRRRKTLMVGVVVLAVLISLFTSLNVMKTYKKEDWKGAAHFLSQSSDIQDSILVYQAYYSVPLERYLQSNIQVKKVSIIREDPRDDPSDKLIKKIVGLSQDSKRIFLVLAGSDVSAEKLSFLMRKTHKLDHNRSFHGIEILVLSKIEGKI